MTKPIAVVAFGGNAILDAGDDGSFTTQLEKAKAACRQMLAILHQGYQLILVHGNGPQVGNLLIQFEKASDVIPVPPSTWPWPRPRACSATCSKSACARSWKRTGCSARWRPC